MVSLTQRQELAMTVAADPQLQRLHLLLDGAAPPTDVASCELGIREQMLGAIAASDAENFRRIANEIGQRKIGPDSDWCQDDYLIFLLLLGQQKFGIPLGFMQTVIEVRMTNVNPVPRRINNVFGALSRQEFGIDGEFGFLKIPFLHLVGRLHIGPSEAKKVLSALSAPGLIESMPPFLRLLTQKSYDLVLTERQPSVIESTAQLVDKFATHAKEFSLSDWVKVVFALPGRLIWGLLVFIFGLGLFPVLLGIGKGIIESRTNIVERLLPTEILIASVHLPGPEFPPEGVTLAKSLQQPVADTEHKSVVVIVETIAFPSATLSFVVEASHLDHPIRAAVAFAKAESKVNRSFTIVPVARDGGRFRAIIPEQQVGSSLCFVLEFEVASAETAESIGRRIVLRPYQ